MKNAVPKIKNLLLGIPKSLIKHQVTVYSSLILTIVFLTLFTTQEIDHAKEITQTRKQNIELQEALDLSSKSFEDAWEIITLQSKSIKKHEETLEGAQDVLNEQSRLIRDLIEYLKKIKHWPPKQLRPEIDPDKWIIFTEE